MVHMFKFILLPFNSEPACLGSKSDISNPLKHWLTLAKYKNLQSKA